MGGCSGHSLFIMLNNPQKFQIFSGIIFGLYLLFNLTDNDSHMRFIFRNHIINHASLHLIPIYIP